MEKLINELKKFDKDILSIMQAGLKFSFVFCIISTLFLVTYENVHIPNLFYIGFSLFRTSLFFVVAFIACAFVFNRAKKIM